MQQSLDVRKKLLGVRDEQANLAFHSLLADLVVVERDTLVVCSDGQFRVNRALVSARNQAIKRMLDGSMLEGVEKIARFPASSVKIVSYLMDFLQFAQVPETASAETWIELYLLADEYCVTGLVEACQTNLKILASMPESAPMVYQLCDIDALTEIKNCAYKTISLYMGGMRVVCKCQKCGDWGSYVSECADCAELIALYGRSTLTCASGHTVQLDNLVCEVLDENEDECGGQCEVSIHGLSFLGVSDETIAELCRKYHNRT